MEYSSIFNDVMGPIAVGPSSSHTAGPARIGKAALLMYGKEIDRATIVFDEKGSYPTTYQGHGTDIGFVGGLMGFAPDDPRLVDALETAKGKGKTIRFTKDDLGNNHPNEARIDIYESDNKLVMSLLTQSIGGGSIVINEMDGFKIFYTGRQKLGYLAMEQQNAAVEELLVKNGLKYEMKLLDVNASTYHSRPADESVLYEIRVPSNRHIDELDAFADIEGLIFLRKADLVVPVAMRDLPDLPFDDAKGALEFSKKTGVNMAELATAYECAWGEITKEQVRENMAEVLRVMRDSVNPPEKGADNGVMEPFAKIMKERLDKNLPIDTGLIGLTMAPAIATMENSNVRNIIVAAPTCGSSGVIPATIVAIGDAMKFSDDDIIDALLASGLVGSFISNHATFGAEAAGCQAEMGSAATMATAGMVQLFGGDVTQGFRASSIAMQSLMGLICDPIGGIAEIPCITRNVTASSMAVTAANMAMLGYDPIISLDDTIIAMMDVGNSLPDTLKCTCKGGLCTTPGGSVLDKFIRSKMEDSL